MRYRRWSRITIFRRTIENLVACATTWSQTLSPGDTVYFFTFLILLTQAYELAVER